MWRLPGKSIISAPRDITIDGVQYPKTIFKKWSVAELNAIGIYPFTEKRVDNRYYKSTGHVDTMFFGGIVRTHTKAPRFTIGQLKKQFADMFKETAMSYLLRIRDNLDYLQEFDPENADEIDVWIAFRNSLKLAFQTVKQEVKAITGYDEMIEYNQSGWQKHIPAAPDEEPLI